MRPLREIFVPQLPDAPPLYRWEMDDTTSSIGGGKDRRDEAPRMPSRGRAIEDELKNASIHKRLPRRPRRSPSPPRPMSDTEIMVNVPLQPLTSDTDGDGSKALVHIDNTAAVSVSHLADASDVSILFCVHNTACGSNRNHGRQLKELADRNPLLNIIEVIKLIQISLKYEVDFHQNYFPLPLYKDETRSLFTAMGERKVSVWKMIKKTPTSLSKCCNKKIKTTHDLRQEFWIQGGFMMFDAQTRLRFVYYDKFAEDLDLEAVEWAVEQARISFVPKSEAAPPPAPTGNKRVSQQFSNNPWHTPPESPPPRQPTRSTEEGVRHGQI